MRLRPRTQKITGKEVNPSPFALEAFNNDIVLDTIISHLGDNHHDLTKYRLVCHKWNNATVRKINASGISLQIPLRYGPEIPLLIVRSEARRLAKEILKTVSNTLTGTAKRLLFDTVVVDRDFYLAGVKAQWTHFLKIHGESIRHLKFKIRSGEVPKPSENHVTDCEEIVSTEDLVAAFSATPNLESLYFSIRFSNYLVDWITQRVLMRMDLGHVPVLYKLTNITIREPEAIPYPRALLKQILGMAPNLTSLCIKPSSDNSTRAFACAMRSMEDKIKGLLTSFKISNVHLPWWDTPSIYHFPYLNLTSLELNHIHGSGSGVGPVERVDWVKKLLQFQHSSLVKLILGNWRNGDSHPLLTAHNAPYPLNATGACLVSFPPVMEHLKFLEVNSTKFGPSLGKSYQIQFPVLESFTLSGASENGNEWTPVHLAAYLPMRSGQSLTLKQFSLIGPIKALEEKQIILSLRMTFPFAEFHFQSLSEAGHQFSLELPSIIQLV